MQGNPVHCGCHAMFAHPIMDIMASQGSGQNKYLICSFGIVGAGKDQQTPPNNKSVSATNASIVFWLATRLATFCGFTQLCFIFPRLSQKQQISPEIRRLKTLFCGAVSSLSVQSLRACWPRLAGLSPATASSTSCGISNGACGQSISSLVPAISSAPSGAPCTFDA